MKPTVTVQPSFVQPPFLYWSPFGEEASKKMRSRETIAFVSQ